MNVLIYVFPTSTDQTNDKQRIRDQQQEWNGNGIVSHLYRAQHLQIRNGFGKTMI